MNIASPTPVFSRQNQLWHPEPQAMGPFGGLHGGAVSGLLTGELETLAADAGHGTAISAQVYLLSPAPLVASETKPVAVREGGRVAVYENELWANGKLQAKASMCFLKGVPAGKEIAGIAPVLQGSEVSEAQVNPDELPVWQFEGKTFGTSYLSAVDVREAPDGLIWLRAVQPLFNRATPFASTMSFADFSTLFSVVAAGRRPAAGGWPNADIGLHLSRLPVGPWIGLKTRSDWFADGRGVTESQIYDIYGRMGRSTQAAVLAPL